MSEHTPGPWAVERDDMTEWEFGDDGIGYHYRVMDEGDCTVARCYQQPHDTWSAGDNARLIAAAPDLLEAAKTVAMHARLGDLHPKDFQILRAAIDKATGVGVQA